MVHEESVGGGFVDGCAGSLYIGRHWWRTTAEHSEYFGLKNWKNLQYSIKNVI